MRLFVFTALAVTGVLFVGPAKAAGGCGAVDPLNPASVFQAGANRDGYYIYIITGYRSAKIGFKAGVPTKTSFDLTSCGLAIGTIQANVSIVSSPPGRQVSVSKIVAPKPDGATKVAFEMTSPQSFKGKIQYLYTLFINSKEHVPPVPSLPVQPSASEILASAQKGCKARYQVTSGGPTCVDASSIEVFVPFPEDKCWFARAPNVQVKPFVTSVQDQMLILSTKPTINGVSVTVGPRGAHGNQVCAEAGFDWDATPNPWPLP